MLKYVDLVNCGDLNAGEVQKARLLEVEYLNKKESRAASAALTRQSQERQGAHQAKMGRHSEELVGALEQALSRKSSAGDQKSMAPPLELAELSMAAKAQWDRAAWFGARRNTRSMQRSR